MKKIMQEQKNCNLPESLKASTNLFLHISAVSAL